MKRITLLCACLLLVACGKEQTLRVPAGASAAPKPATAPSAPTTDDLLQHRASERPGRSDELLTKSQPRPDDPFNLPPK